MPDNKYSIVPKLSLCDEHGNRIDVEINEVPGLVDVLYSEREAGAPGGRKVYARITVARNQLGYLVEMLKQACADDRFWES